MLCSPGGNPHAPKKKLQEFTGKNLSEFAESFRRVLETTSQTHASERVK